MTESDPMPNIDGNYQWVRWALVSRARRSTERESAEWCGADPGPFQRRCLERSRISGAPFRFASRCTASGTRSVSPLLLVLLDAIHAGHPLARRAKPVLLLRHQLVALLKDADPHHV